MAVEVAAMEYSSSVNSVVERVTFPVWASESLIWPAVKVFPDGLSMPALSVVEAPSVVVAVFTITQCSVVEPGAPTLIHDDAPDEVAYSRRYWVVVAAVPLLETENLKRRVVCFARSVIEVFVAASQPL